MNIYKKTTKQTKKQKKQSKPKRNKTLLEHRPDVLGSGFIVQVLCGESEEERDNKDQQIS